jgi:DNA-binding response OmpR family regulator
MAKVLIIEDDELIAKAMASHLADAGFDPLWVGNGEAGITRLRYERPDVCVLDLMLPLLDGWKVIETARGEGIGTPIVVVSARGSEQDRIHALEIGADDYLVKPFSMRELVARVGAAARRGVRPAEEKRGEAVEIEELRIDPREVQAYVDGRSVELTPTEFRLLYTLALDRGRVVTRDELLQKVWGRRETHRDRTVDVFVRRLRQKIDRVAPRHSFIQTRFGVGYKLEAEPK